MGLEKHRVAVEVVLMWAERFESFHLEVVAVSRVCSAVAQ